MTRIQNNIKMQNDGNKFKVTTKKNIQNDE